MSEIAKLNERLAGMKLRTFPGTNPNTTKEELAKEINRVLDAIEAGDYEEVTDVE